MNCNDPKPVVCRDGQLIVSRLADRQVSKINDSIDSCYRIATAQNPAATPPPAVTSAFIIHSKTPARIHQLFVHRLDFRPALATPVGTVVAFSEPEYAISNADCTDLQLGTPAFYREQKSLKPGIRDRHDGTITRDIRPFLSKRMGRAAIQEANVSFASMSEPWVFCAAHFRWTEEFHRLEEQFAEEYGYTAAARIIDSDAFALWLGIDFAQSLGHATLVKLSALDKIGYGRSSCTSPLWEGSRTIDTIVHVYHGPVDYRDNTGQITAQEEWFDPFAGPTAWFTKNPGFRMQSEYRFAVSTLGDPIRRRLNMAISPELRELTVAGKA